MRRDIVWEWLDEPGLEHLVLDIGPDGVTAESLVLMGHGSGLARLRYRLRCTPDWRTRAASFRLETGGGSRGLEILRDGDGWRVDGQLRADLAGAAEIDIRVTPLTNTLAIRQLALKPGETRTFRTVYVRVPEMTVEAMDQDYTRLDPAEPPRRFRYASPGFTAEIGFDAEGLVVDYPPAWRRRTL
jgi:hypothetical protein